MTEKSKWALTKVAEFGVCLILCQAVDMGFEYYDHINAPLPKQKWFESDKKYTARCDKEMATRKEWRPWNS